MSHRENPFNESACSQRVEVLRRGMEARALDALVIPVSANLRYLTGLRLQKTERLTALLVSQDRTALVCPSFEEERVRQSTSLVDLKYLLWRETDDPFAQVRAFVSQATVSGKSRVGVEPHTWFREFDALRECLPKAEFVDAGCLIADLRCQKSDEEIEAVRTAVQLGSLARESLRDALTDGITEHEATVPYAKRALQLQTEAYHVSVSFGVNTASPHGGSRPLRLEPQMVVLVDAGISWWGYLSDITRTWSHGPPPGRLKEILRVVGEAQQAALDTIRPGIPADRVDRAARAVIEAAGLGQYFTTRLGHGVGLEIHEPPWIAQGVHTPLREGMLFTVEPGVYIPGAFGVRTEDMVLVTKDGCVKLHESC